MSEILDELIARGVSSKTIQAVVELIANDKAITDRRANDAARQQRHRQRNVTSRDVPLCHVTQRDPLMVSPITPSLTPSSKPKRVSRSTARRVPIPDDWLPDADYATARGWSLPHVQTEAQRFRDHAKANNRLQADWPAAWRNWVTSPYQKAENVNGKSAANGIARTTTAGDRARELAAIAREKEREMGIARSPDTQ
jgi:hypothetical protein